MAQEGHEMVKEQLDLSLLPSNNFKSEEVVYK